MLVYDVTNEKSFDNIRSWIREIEDVVSKDMIFIYMCVVTYKLLL